MHLAPMWVHTYVCSRCIFRPGLLEDARLQAIIGSCPKSHESAKSGMRFWRWFAVSVLGVRGDVFPPKLADLLVWSRLFRCHKTFGNYLSYVKLGCEMEGASVDVFSHPSLKRAKVAIVKRRWVTCGRIPIYCFAVSVVMQVAGSSCTNLGVP